jgi:hypothetical protein
MNAKDRRARLDAALDERRDPLEDTELVAALESDDEALAELATWRAMERALAVQPLPVAARRRPWLALVLAASALLGVGLWIVLRERRAPQANAQPASLGTSLPTASAFEVLRFRAAIEHRTASGTRRWEQVGLGPRASCRREDEIAPHSDLAHASFTFTIDHP